VAGLQNISVGSRVADREIEVAEQPQPGQEGDREPRRRPQRAREQEKPAGDGEQRRQQAEEALALAAPAPDTEVVAPDVAVRGRDRLVDEVRAKRISEDVREAEADVEARGAPVPDRLVLRRDGEDRVAVLDRLP